MKLELKNKFTLKHPINCQAYGYGNLGWQQIIKLICTIRHFRKEVKKC